MSDIADRQNIADDSVTVTVDGVNILFDVLFYHGTLKFSTLICIESYIVCIRIVIQRRHIKLACGTAGWLTVKPY